MKKRVITISAIVVGVLIIGWFCIFILLPRVMLYNMVRKYLPSIDNCAEYFTDFDIANNNSVQTIDNGYVSVKIPSDYHHETKNLELMPYLYISPDTEETVAFIKEPHDLSGLNLLRPENFENIEDIPKDVGINEIISGFESIGKGLPDSAYNTYKLMLLINKDDYSFWDIKKGTCFSIIAVMKEVLMPQYEEFYLYEKDNIRGIVMVSKVEDKYHVIFEIYNADDLNTVHTLIIGVKNIYDAYAIINSAEFI